jgi:hypothetical protein
VALQRIESSVAWLPRYPFWGTNPGERAGGRHADTTGTFNRQHALLKAASGELASRLWDLLIDGQYFALLPGLFDSQLGRG